MRIRSRYQPWLGPLMCVGVVLLGYCALISSGAWAQRPAGAPDGATDPPQRVLIRFATTDDYPPFNARDEDNVMVGLNVDLARAICLELEVTCEVDTREWEALMPALGKGEIDAVIAAHRINVETLGKADFTNAYFRTPGRFAILRRGPSLDISPNGLDRRSIGVAKGTAHEAFVQTFFRTSRIERFDTPEQARAALKDGKIDTIFDDGIGLIFWINGSSSAGCCDLAGGAYLEPMFFGDGIGIAVKPGNRGLKADLDRAIEALRESGRMLELIQRYFPRQVY